MSESTTEGTETATEGTETATTETQQSESTDLPADHPLVKTLAAQKAEIKDLKGRAKRLDELEESQKTQAQKDAERISKAEAEVATVPAKVADALKTHLVALHGFDTEDVELFLTATEPDLLLKQVTRLVGQSGKRKSKNHVPGEGQNTSAASSDEATFARDFFSG